MSSNRQAGAPGVKKRARRFAKLRVVRIFASRAVHAVTHALYALADGGAFPLTRRALRSMRARAAASSPAVTTTPRSAVAASYRTAPRYR